MRQVLVTLANSLNRWPNQEQANVLRRDILERFLLWIDCPNYTSTLKAALQGLQYFISKGMLSFQDVVGSLQRRASTVDFSPVENYNSQITGGGPAAASSRHPDFSGPDLGTSSDDLVEAFISNLLAWVSHTEVATSATRLISTFLKSLRTQSSEENHFYHSITKLPLWVSPLKRILEEKPELVEALKHHVLPELFMLSPEDLRDFIKNLHLERCLSGNVSAGDRSDVLLLLSSLQVAQDLGLVRVTGTLVLLIWV